MSLQISEESYQVMKLLVNRIQEVHTDVLFETEQLLKAYAEIYRTCPNNLIQQELENFIKHLEDSEKQKREQRMVRKIKRCYNTIADYIDAELHREKSE
jgi:DNA phosphorothioation-dependent restriction protein DptG